MIDDTQLEAEEDADPTQQSTTGSAGEPLSQPGDPTEVSILVEAGATRVPGGRRPPTRLGRSRSMTGDSDETEEGEWHGEEEWAETNPDGIPGFLLQRRIGAGGMGEVYVAERQGPEGKDDQQLALKVLSRVSATRLWRFKREFRTLADVAHPNLVKLYELGVRSDGRAFFTMELLEDALPFVRYVRGPERARGEPPPRERLAGALRQLLEGVAELHRHGYVHRDLKPSNVLVTPEGRVVVLDFGLITTLDDDEEGVTVDGQVVGTPAYMAPEQARGERVGRAADLYAVGVMLYESLTGSKPVDGSAIQQLANKDATLELERALSNAPTRMRQLCAELLARDPIHRPSALELLERLTPMSSSSGSFSRPRESTEPFIGRERELELLGEAYERSARRPAVVHLRGAEGLGKSALLREFRARLRERDCLILHGRCRLHEAVPYKGMDAIVDALSVHLRRLSADELERLRVREAAALARMFPVLDELWSHTNIRYLSPKELRGVAWAALRELLAALSEPRQLVLIIDDFHWSDVDSVRLLTELLQPPRAPALLLVLALRDELGREQVLEALSNSASIGPAVSEQLVLGPLPESEAHELAQLLAEAQRRRAPAARRQPSGGIWAESVALRSGGNPFFITQLVQHADTSVSDPADLDVFVVRRLAELDEPSRRMLELVAVSGGPIDEALVLELSEGGSVEVLAGLRTAGLVVTGTGVTPIPWGRRIEVAHERVRQATLDRLEPRARAELHAHLGEALLARCEEPPTGELLFLIVDQLTAGVLELDELDEARRVEIARLACKAGQGAHDMASPDLATGYFEQAARFAEPWMEAATRGEGHARLCAAITLGRARTTADSNEANAIFAELIGWQLAPSAYGEVVIDYFWSLFEAERSAEAVTLGLTALRELGFPLPRRPSLRWMSWNLLLGRRAAKEFSGEQLASMRYVADESQRAAMRIMALVSWWGTYVGNPFWGIGLAGMHARLVAREGFHELAGLGLCMHAIHLFQGFMADDAFALDQALEGCDARARMGATDRANLHMFRPFMAGYRSPFYARVDEFQAALLTCLELGQIHIAVPYFITLTSLRLWSGRPINENLELLAEVRLRSGRPRAFHLHVFEVISSTMSGLLEGSERLAMVEVPEFEVAGFGYMFQANLAALGLCFDDYERVGAMLDLAETQPDFQRMMSLLSEGSVYALASTIVHAERGLDSDGRERRRLRATMRKRRSAARSWAERCEANWGPMLALIEAELAAFDAHYDAANSHYERARELAGSNHNHWIAGLASQRLARLAERRRQPLVAKAGYEAAREHYRQWGAHALVRHLDGLLEETQAELEG